MKKRKYLYRLIAVIVLMLILIILFSELFWKKSFEEMEKSNEIYYERTLNSYVTLFDEIIENLSVFAFNISTESKKSESVFWDGVEKLDENYYELYNVTQFLKKKYTRSDVSEWGIYLYEIDKIIKPEKTMSLEQFMFKIDDVYGYSEGLTNFFSLENYELSKRIYGTTNSDNFYEGNLLLGICTEIGKNNDKALIFFLISPSDIEDSLVIMNEDEMEFYLRDNSSGQIMLAWGSNVCENIEKVLGAEDFRASAGLKQKVLYNKDSNYSPFNINVYISENSLQNNIVTYAFTMRKIILFTNVIMLIVCACVLYIAYKPVHELTSELDYMEGGEFEFIREVLDSKRSKIMEQEMLIMDLLINHLVYGVHVSEKSMKRLGVDSSMRYYCVFLLDGYILASNEEQKITSEIEQKYQARVFIAKWKEDNKSIFIIFSMIQDATPVQTYLKEWIERNIIKECFLYAGKVVDKMDDIQLSLRSCFEQEKKRISKEQKQNINVRDVDEKEKMQKRMKEEILAYLDLYFKDCNLSQVQVADSFNISNYTLSRLFKNQVGVGFSEYLVAKRLEYAKELLLTTSYSINEISIMSGFSSINYFSRTFKLYVGISPTIFRNQVKI